MSATTVCWVQHGGEIEWASAIAGFLAEREITVRFVSFLREFSEAYAARGLPSDFIGTVYAASSPLPDSALVELEQRYGPPPLHCIGASDVHVPLIIGDDRDGLRQIVARALIYWERYIAEHNIAAFIVRDVAGIATRSVRQVADRLGIPTLQLGVGPDNSRFAIYDRDVNWCWSEFLDELAKPPRTMTATESARVDAYIAERTPAAVNTPMQLKLDALKLWHVPIALLRYRQQLQAIDHTHDPVAPAVVQLHRRLLLQRWWWRMSRPLHRYDEPRDEPYVYLPLFHREETGHLVNIRFWCHHVEELIETVAEALPTGHRLYLKEHPAILGDFSRAALRRLRRIPGVRILAPEIRSHRLTAGARAVVTLQGTVGWEAFLLRRPLIALAGKPFYAYSPLVYHIEDVCRLDTVLSEAIRDGEKRYAEQHDSWVRFIDCVLRTAPPGLIETFEYPHRGDQGRDNLIRIVDAIARKIPLPAVPAPRREAIKA
jgi:hypothetical protein